jgi:hypothetical protein
MLRLQQVCMPNMPVICSAPGCLEAMGKGSLFVTLPAKNEIPEIHYGLECLEQIMSYHTRQARPGTRTYNISNLDGMEEVLMPHHLPSNSPKAHDLRIKKYHEITEIVQQVEQSQDTANKSPSSGESSDSETLLRISRLPNADSIAKRYKKQGLTAYDQRKQLKRRREEEEEEERALAEKQAKCPRYQWYSVSSHEEPMCICYCREPEDDADLVQCSNEFCLIGWFHFDCCEDQLNEAKFYCEFCKDGARPETQSDDGGTSVEDQSLSETESYDATVLVDPSSSRSFSAETAVERTVTDEDHFLTTMTVAVNNNDKNNDENDYGLPVTPERRTSQIAHSTGSGFTPINVRPMSTRQCFENLESDAPVTPTHQKSDFIYGNTSGFTPINPRPISFQRLADLEIDIPVNPTAKSSGITYGSPSGFTPINARTISIQQDEGREAETLVTPTRQVADTTYRSTPGFTSVNDQPMSYQYVEDVKANTTVTPTRSSSSSGRSHGNNNGSDPINPEPYDLTPADLDLILDGSPAHNPTPKHHNATSPRFQLTLAGIAPYIVYDDCSRSSTGLDQSNIVAFEAWRSQFSENVPRFTASRSHVAGMRELVRRRLNGDIGKMHDSDSLVEWMRGHTSEDLWET